MAASFVLGALLVEMNRLYGNLTRALALADRRNAELSLECGVRSSATV